MTKALEVETNPQDGSFSKHVLKPLKTTITKQKKQKMNVILLHKRLKPWKRLAGTRAYL